jgi:hypothetical protein
MQRIIVRCFAIAVFVLITFPLGSMAQQSQHALNRRLRGDYPFKRFRSCIQNKGGFTNDLKVLPPVNANFRAGAASGIRSYNGDGTGTITGMNLNTFSVPDAVLFGAPGSRAASQSDFACNTTYNVAPDGTFSENFTCTGTVIAGPNVGRVFSSTGVQVNGQIGVGNNILTLSDHSPNVETVQFWNVGSDPTQDPPDFVRFRICGRTGTAVKVQ